MNYPAHARLLPPSLISYSRVQRLLFLLVIKVVIVFPSLSPPTYPHRRRRSRLRFLFKRNDTSMGRGRLSKIITPHKAVRLLFIVWFFFLAFKLRNWFDFIFSYP